MKRFDIKRFSTLLRWSVAEERGFLVRSTIMVTLAVAVILFLAASTIEARPEVFFNDAADGSSWSISGVVVMGLMLFVLSVYWCVMMVGFSLSFRCLGSKRQRISYLARPATNLEKFLSRVLLVSVGGLLMLAVSFVVADLLQFLFVRLMFERPHFGLFLPRMTELLGGLMTDGKDSLFTNVMHGGESRRMYMLYMSGMAGLGMCREGLVLPGVALRYAFDMGMFLFCAAFFRRHAWVFSWLVYVAFSLLAAFVPVEMSWLQAAVMGIGVVAFPVGAYRIFTRMQVINNKITNI